MYTYKIYDTSYSAIPCFCSPCYSPLTSLWSPLLTWKPSFGVMRSCPPWSPVACKLTSPFSFPPHPFPIPNSQHPGSTVRFTETTLRFRLLLVRNRSFQGMVTLGMVVLGMVQVPFVRLLHREKKKSPQKNQDHTCNAWMATTWNLMPDDWPHT